MKPTLDMTVSPYDRGSAPEVSSSLVQLRYRRPDRWVPSRYNARTVDEDGRLLLWNTLSGALNSFEVQEATRVLARLSPQGLSEPLDRAGEYLARRGYLVRDNVDQVDLFRYRYAQQQWRSDALQLILLASEDCNFRCVYCYEQFERGMMTPETREGVRNLLLQRAPQLKQLRVSWFGGEPLYGWEAIEELEPVFNHVAQERGIPFAQQMTTNGYLLTEERATKLLDWGCRNYQITVDGLPAQHDCKRVGRDGSPTYNVIMDNLRSLRERRGADFRVDLRVNFDRDNFPMLGPFLESLSEDFAGDKRFAMRFRAVGKWGGARDAELSTCGVDAKSYQRQLQAQARELDLHQEGGVHLMAPPGSQVCYAARPFNFIVGATGKLMKCTIALYDMPENVVGQLHPDGTMELEDEHMRRWVNPHWETDSLCKTCYVLPGCQGAACPLTRVRDGYRTCAGVKSNLKHEMRHTLRTIGAPKPASVPVPVPAEAEVMEPVLVGV
ncbi:MAG TPA: radical SAM protein [Longimicrobium sp.]|jgi:uncharacterized protein|uniref:radical SAM/SPASM domain-containing protein n=1 Tax=Longimicrobium sp. TaxID=2029185 RepID=UPI002EDB1FE4